MRIKEVIEDTKIRAAQSKRRATAVREHGKAVVVTGVDAAKNVAAVAARNLKTTLETQRATLTDSGMPIVKRVKKLRTNAEDAAMTAKSEITTAVKEGYRAVSDRLHRVTAVTHKEQAVENKIGRKVKKAKKAAQAAT